MNIRELKFKEDRHQCLEAQATWNVLDSDEGSYAVVPLTDWGNDDPYAWAANYYTSYRNAYDFPVDGDKDEYATQQEAIYACQKHNRERCIALISEMLA